MSDKNNYSKSKKAAPKSTSQGVKLNSVICPVCRSILSEPVSLPCNHAFCRPCFEGSMEHSNLVCPLCRLRISSWYRRAKKEGKLVNEELWKTIQREHPMELKNKLRGIDSTIENDQPVIIVARPGELRKEYEKEKQKHLDEQRKARIAEENASAALIKKLEEEEKLRQEMEEAKLRLDALLAKKLAEELNVPSTSKATQNKPTKSTIKGPLDRFLISKDKSDRLCHKLSDRKISPYLSKTVFHSKGKVSISPTLKFGKECHVLDVEQSPRKAKRDSSLFADLDFQDFLGDWKRKGNKVEQAPVRGQAERKTSASGHKSSASGANSEDIDQEFKYYFKPINPEKRYHLPWKPPLNVNAIRPVSDGAIPIRPLLGEIQVPDKTRTAFALFRSKCQLSPASSCSILEDERPSTSYKRKTSSEGHMSNTKKHRLLSASRPATPLFGFDNASPDFQGFTPSDVAATVTSERAVRDVTQRLEAALEVRVGHRNDMRKSATDINENISGKLCSKKPIGGRIPNGISKSLRSNTRKPTLSQESSGTPESDSDESLHNAINKICDKLWDSTPERCNGVNKTGDKCLSDIGAVMIDVDKSPRKKTALRRETSVSIAKRKKQEQADFEYAKKLQAQFDMIRVSNTTRSGTQRQRTLN